MCLKFPKFEAGCAYKLVAYKKKRVIDKRIDPLLKKIMNREDKICKVETKRGKDIFASRGLSRLKGEDL